MAQPIRFVLSNEDAHVAGSDPVESIKEQIRRVIPFARAYLISGTRMVAFGLGSSGRVFLGISVELPGLPLQHSINAEQFLIANLALNSERMITLLAVSPDGSYFDTPHGQCCQFIQEIRNSPSIKILITDLDGSNASLKTLGSLFVKRTGPHNVIPSDISLLLGPRDNGLKFLDDDSYIDVCMGDDYCIRMARKALAAANESFAPYSNCPSGVVLKDCQAKLYTGWYMESVANNPSLGPVQAALVDFVAKGGGQFGRIAEAVLVEKKDAVVRQEETARMILKNIAPHCDLKVVHCS